MARTKQTARRPSGVPTNRPTTGGLRLSVDSLNITTNPTLAKRCHPEEEEEDKGDDDEEEDAPKYIYVDEEEERQGIKRARFAEPNPKLLYDINGTVPPPPEFSQAPHSKESEFTHEWCLALHQAKHRARGYLMRLMRAGTGSFVSFHYAFRERPNKRFDRIYYIPMERLTMDQLVALMVFHNRTSEDTELAPNDVVEMWDQMEEWMRDAWEPYGVDLGKRNVFMDRPTIVHFFYQHEVNNDGY